MNLEPLLSHWQAVLTAIVVCVTLVMLLVGRRAPDMVMIGGVVVLLAAGVLTPEEALKGMSNEGMLTVAALFVVAASIERTGALAALVDRALGRPESLASAQLRTMVAPAALSAFMNNTPVVALMVPAIRDWAKKNRLSVSKLLMPMNAAVVLGGLCTLIGTSTNIVVSGLVSAKRGHGLGMFDITWLGIPLLLAGLVYLLFASKYLLKDRRPAMSQTDDPRQYSLEMLVEPGSPLVGRNIEEAGLRGLDGLFLMEIDRDGHVIAAVAPTERLETGDRLVFVGIVDSVVELQKIRGLRPATDQVFKLDNERSERVLVEAVVSNTCPLVGRTIREGRFRSTYDAVVIAVARNGERLQIKIGDIALEPGDTLLVEASPAFLERQRSSRHFYLVSEVRGSTPPRHDQAWIACTALAAMVLAATLELVPMVAASLFAAAIVISMRCISSNEARRSIEWESLLLIAASFGLARALDKTGLAEGIAQSTIAVAGDHPHLVLAAIYFVAMLFTELMSNNAAAVLVFPIAWQTASDLGVNPMPFVMAVTVAASCGFATPMGYQTNLMIYGPGGYKFSDYVRFGGPLNLLVMALTVALAPLIWPFH
ncbi:MAG: SLC13 family permease [Planctomycetia bacterium]|nr:SLC13 family permease [Planctomycetia bacterium]RLT13089.1 MAG: SLC13 family permease [Planctomycetota bacterium]